MGLQFYIGNSGTGKSQALYERVLKEAGENLRQRYLVLVPEQFTMQTQKDFVRMSPTHGILNIDVLSFERLAFRVLEETGAGRLPVLDEIGKIFLVRRAAQEKKEELLLMGRYLSKIGYINEVKSMISELVQYGVNGELLESIVEKNRRNQQMYAKLHDVNLIYEAFTQYLQEKYVTTEELLDVLCRMAPKSEFIKNAVIVLDGFTGFTPVQKKLIGRLLGLCRDMWMTVTYDTSLPVRNDLPDYHLFYMSAKMRKQVMAMAEELKIRQAGDIIFAADKNMRFMNNPPMAHLEKSLFRNTGEAYMQEQDNIHIHVCRNPLEEMQSAAEQIRRLVIERGYRYRDIAVVTGDLALYGNYAERVFEQYGIPYFSDYKRNAMANPAVACIRSLLACVVRDFTYEAVGRLWKSGMVPMEQTVLDQMQNYILAKGIRGRRRWESPWESPQRSMTQEELLQLNTYREQFITPLLSFGRVIRSKRTTVREKTIELYQLLEQYEMQQQLTQYQQYFEAHGQQAMAKEYSQMYDVIVQILESLAGLLGDEKMGGEEYAKLLDAGFAEMKVGIVPPGVDQVMVGDIERSRLKDIRALFFIGVNDGTVPKHKPDAGILSELERDSLREQGVELSPGREEQYYRQRFYLYLNMTKPRERLYLSYSKVNAKGEAMNPSYLIKTVQKLFPNIEVEDEEESRKHLAGIVSPVNAINYVIAHMHTDKPEGFYPLYRWFEQREEYRWQLAGLRTAVMEKGSADRLHAAVAKALYTNELAGSVTRLEQYAACAYAHFLQYGIGAKEREEYGFQGLDFGNLLHQTLELYAEELSRRGLRWGEAPEELQEQLVEWCVTQAVTAYDSTVLYYTARDTYRVTRLKRFARRTVWALTKQLAEGEFQPSGYELQFRNEEPIRNGLEEAARLNLKGRIDRMDLYEKEQDVYVKVMDYKTGKKEFRLLNVYNGTQLQLVVYLQAAMRHEQNLHPQKQILPAGIVYYHVQDPLIEKSAGPAGEQLLKELCVDGVVSEKTEVLAAMDRAFQEQQAGYESQVIPVSLKKDGTLTARSKTMSEEEFVLVMDYAAHKMKEMAEEILAGDIRINPYQEGQRSSCTYCNYKSICMQKLDGKPMEYLKQEKIDETELYVRMRRELEQKE